MLCVVAACAALIGCSDELGGVSFTTWGEEYIETGIPADVFEDGWSVRYKRFLLVIGDVRIADAAGEVGAAMQGLKIVNHVVPGAKDLMAFEDIEAKAWTDVSYGIRPPATDSELAAGATEDDKKLMLNEGYSVFVEAEAKNGDVTKSFAWGFNGSTALTRCKGDKDGKETDGVLVTNGGTDTVELTIHGDHFFYDDLQGANAKVRFAAIAAADADNDGTITLEELSAVQLVDIEEGTYGTGSAADVNDLRQFVTALSRTLGHFRGEGECAVH